MQSDQQRISLGPIDQNYQARLKTFSGHNVVRRLWEKDGTLWSSDPKTIEFIPTAMGWLDVVEKVKPHAAELTSFAKEIKEAGFERVVVAGMGGSSLCTLVLQTAFPSAPGLPLSVLDSTDPGTVLRIEKIGPIEKTLFVVASKSGSTAEPNAFNDYFYEAVSAPDGGFYAVGSTASVGAGLGSRGFSPALAASR